MSGLEQTGGYWNVFFGLSMRQGFSLAENNAICETRGILSAKWQGNHIKIITNRWLSPIPSVPSTGGPDPAHVLDLEAWNDLVPGVNWKEMLTESL